MDDVLRAFLTVFPAELPDKSMVATIVLVTRYHRPLAVWLGAVAAFTVHVFVAVAAGSVLGLLPEDAVAIGVAVLFAVGAVVLFRSARSAEADHRAREVLGGVDPTGPAEGGGVPAEAAGTVDVRGAVAGGPGVGAPAAGAVVGVRSGSTPRRAFGGAFGLIVLAEWGDLTQLATASLAARSGAPVATGAGALAALAAVAAVASTVGRQVVSRVALHWINYVGAAVFAVLAVWSVSEVIFS